MNYVLISLQYRRQIKCLHRLDDIFYPNAPTSNMRYAISMRRIHGCILILAHLISAPQDNRIVPVRQMTVVSAKVHAP